MPKVTILATRCALLHLALGWTLGAVLLLHKAGLFVLPQYIRWLTLHTQTLLFGFFAQLCIAIAFWIAPKFAGRAEQTRGNPQFVHLALVTLNASVVLSILHTGLSSTARFLALAAFALHLWPRIKPFSSTSKEAA